MSTGESEAAVKANKHICLKRLDGVYEMRGGLEYKTSLNLFYCSIIGGDNLARNVAMHQQRTGSKRLLTNVNTRYGFSNAGFKV